jgi:hypothetical protein
MLFFEPTPYLGMYVCTISLVGMYLCTISLKPGKPQTIRLTWSPPPPPLSPTHPTLLMSELQGYLAHMKTPTPLGLPLRP